MADFSRVAPVYDTLANLVFGKTLMEATKSGFSWILPGDSVLIMGGGTGKVLETLDELGIPLNVWFMDSSEGMLELARKRRLENIDVQFIEADSRGYSFTQPYDIILTPFFLDCFTTKELVSNRRWIDGLKPDGHWLFADFVPTNSWIKDRFIELMYLFFRLTAGLKISRTPDYDQFFRGMSLIQKQSFYGNMIESRVYRKS